ncbi:MAG: hypothetical protein R6V47_03405 [Candidatus Delongbacteria bacterium]
MINIKKILSLLLMTVILTPLLSESELQNNYYNIDNGLVFGYDRYGRKSSESSSESDSFSYFIRSLVLPGWGEYKLGYKKQAAVFLITDILLIGTAAGFNYYSNVRTDEYREYAQMYAGVDPSGKSDTYWLDISNYNNTLSYNESRNVKRFFAERYDDANDYWYWESEEYREKYDDIRISAENSNTWFYYSVGGIVLNHLLSALNASGKASSVTTELSQSFDKGGNLTNKLKLTYEF